MAARSREGEYAVPLQLEPGRSYQVGATEYGGPEDPSSGDYGAIADPAQSYLPAHPDSYAELSVLDTNPANGGTFTFADANALDRLPYLTGLRVSHDGRTALIYKRDIGYGQGPGQTDRKRAALSAGFVVADGEGAAGQQGRGADRARAGERCRGGARRAPGSANPSRAGGQRSRRRLPGRR